MKPPKRFYSLVFILAIVLIGNVQCRKYCELHHHEPPPPKQPESAEQIITSNSWMIYEDHGYYGTLLIDYKRGRDPVLNTQNLDGDSIRFTADSTGTQWITDGSHFPITWNFSNSQQNQLKFTLMYNPSFWVYYTWDFSTLTKDTLRYVVHYSVGAINDSETVVRIPSR